MFYKEGLAECDVLSNKVAAVQVVVDVKYEASCYGTKPVLLSCEDVLTPAD